MQAQGADFPAGRDYAGREQRAEAQQRTRKQPAAHHLQRALGPAPLRDRKRQKAEADHRAARRDGHQPASGQLNRPADDVRRFDRRRFGQQHAGCVRLHYELVKLAQGRAAAFRDCPDEHFRHRAKLGKALRQNARVRRTHHEPFFPADGTQDHRVGLGAGADQPFGQSQLRRRQQLRLGRGRRGHGFLTFSRSKTKFSFEPSMVQLTAR